MYLAQGLSDDRTCQLSEFMYFMTAPEITKGVGGL